MPDNEKFDRVEAVMRKHQHEEIDIQQFEAWVKGVTNHFIIRRRWHLWGLIPDGSSVEAINIGGDNPWRLRVWQIPDLDNIYVDNTKRLVARTPQGEFYRVGFDDFTPDSHRRIAEAIKRIV